MNVRGIAYRQSCLKTFSSGLFFLENAPPMNYHRPFFYAGGKLHMSSSDRADVFGVPAGGGDKNHFFVGPSRPSRYNNNG